MMQKKLKLVPEGGVALPLDGGPVLDGSAFCVLGTTIRTGMLSLSLFIRSIFYAFFLLDCFLTTMCILFSNINKAPLNWASYTPFVSLS